MSYLRKTLLLSPLIVLMASAITSSSAVASAGWLVNKEDAVGQEVTLSSGELTLEANTGQIVKCTKSTGEGTLEGGEGLVTEIVLTGCATNEEGCVTLTSGQPAGTLVFEDLPTLVVERKNGTETILADEFKGEKNGTHEIAKLEFEAEPGKTCGTLFFNTALTGKVAAKIENATDSLTFPKPEFSGNTLTAFGVATKLTGTIKQELVGGGELEAVKAEPPPEVPIWKFNGKKLEKGETKKFNTETKGAYAFVFKSPGVTNIECEDQKFSGTVIGGVPGTDESKFEFSKCAVLEPAEACKVKEPITISSKTRLQYLIRKNAGETWKGADKKAWEAAKAKGEGTAYGDKFTPSAGNMTIIVELTGSPCKAFKRYLVAGFFRGLFNNTNRNLSFTEESSNLSYLGAKWLLTHEVKMELEGGGELTVE